MLPRHYSLLRVFITFAAVLISALPLRADDLNITGNATIAGDTDLRGPVSFGRLTEDPNAKGFNVDVSQEEHLFYNEVFTEGYMQSQQTWVEYGNWDTQYTYTDIYGWVNNGYWVPDTYDESGNITSPGYYVDNWQWVVVGQDVTSNTVWVSAGGNYEQTSTWIPGYYTSVLDHQTFDAPQVRLSGTRSNTTWVWRNPNTSGTGAMRELMVLSTGGLSFPAPDDATSSSRALLTHASFEQSYTSPQTAGTYQSFGSKVGKNKIETWDHLGQSYNDPNSAGSVYNVLENKNESTLEPIGLTLKNSESADGGTTMTTTTTTITPSSASFGGAVVVNGPVNIVPQGDLSMGTFTHQPQN